MDAKSRWGSAAISPNEVVHRQNPLVFFVTFVVHFSVSRPKWDALKCVYLLKIKF